jgi:hypothetical protein
MKFVVFFGIFFAGANSEYIRRHRLVGPKPQPVEFHGLQGLDVDTYRPPEHEPALDALRAQIDDMEKKENERIHHQLLAVQKAEKDFLESDLHKEAINARLFHVIG